MAPIPSFPPTLSLKPKPSRLLSHGHLAVFPPACETNPAIDLCSLGLGPEVGLCEIRRRKTHGWLVQDMGTETPTAMSRV